MARTKIERYRRRDGLDIEKCIPIRLADGQDWYFPRPIIELRPKFRKRKGQPLEAVSINRVLTCGKDLDELVQYIAATSDFDEQVKATLRLGGDLLLRNYPDLTQRELEEMLRVQIDETDIDGSLVIVKAIMVVVTGMMPGATTDPKEAADGSV